MSRYFPDFGELIAPDLMIELAIKHGTLVHEDHFCKIYNFAGVLYITDPQESKMDQNKYTREEKEANWGDELDRAEKYPEGVVEPEPFDYYASEPENATSKPFPPDGDSRLEFAEEVETADYGQLWFTNSGGHDFQVHDLSVELTRKYLYPDGEIIIDNPATLFIAASGSHRVLGEDGWVTWLPAGFKCIQWLPRDGDNPVGF